MWATQTNPNGYNVWVLVGADGYNGEALANGGWKSKFALFTANQKLVQSMTAATSRTHLVEFVDTGTAEPDKGVRSKP